MRQRQRPRASSWKNAGEPSSPSESAPSWRLRKAADPCQPPAPLSESLKPGPGISRAANNQRHVPARVLRMRNVELHGLLRVQSILVDIADHADDRAHGIAGTVPHPLADGVFSRPQLLCHRFVNQRDRRMILIILFGEEAPLEQRN